MDTEQRIKVLGKSVFTIEATLEVFKQEIAEIKQKTIDKASEVYQIVDNLNNAIEKKSAEWKSQS